MKLVSNLALRDALRRATFGGSVARSLARSDLIQARERKGYGDSRIFVLPERHMPLAPGADLAIDEENHTRPVIWPFAAAFPASSFRATYRIEMPSQRASQEAFTRRA